ncbi:MAG TPA: energy transducer TonB [Methylotenera sp.]|nr:energy transducer TonB [Methylotenera sp.]
MKTNLKLVVNTREVTELDTKVVNKKTEVEIRDLVPNCHQVSEVTVRQKTSHMWLAAVVLAHIFGMVWLANAQTTPPALKPSLPPMMVSLVSSPAPEPEVVPLVPTPPQPQPVIKKQKPIVKEKPLMPEPVASEPVAEPVAVSEAPPTPATPTVEAKAPVVTEVAQAKPEPEPVIEPPKFGAAYLHNPAPSYPPLSRRLGEQGRVLLRVLVSSNGDADTVDLEDSSGFSKLDQAAIQAVKKWRFIPAKRSNQPISAYVLVPVKFSLES